MFGGYRTQTPGFLAYAVSLAQVPDIDPDSAAHFHQANERQCTLLIYDYEWQFVGRGQAPT
jgi:hypothetical protein